jgi:hypothetical protein
MSTRRLRPRLDRLEKTPLPVGARSDFRIDPAVAKALRDDSMRVKELWRSRSYIGAPSEEEAMLRARIARLADTIVCPASYGAWQAREDERLMGEREIIANDARHAQLAARIAVFNRTPEGRARERIMELEDKRWESLDALFNGLRPEDQKEVDSLKALYPDLPPDPNDFMYEADMRFLERRAEQEALKLEAQERAREDAVRR